jgi:hypothetical protein
MSPTPKKDRFFDNTRTSDSRRCLRFFYFRHERNWTQEGFSPPLAGGLAWHCAMDSLWTDAAARAKGQNLTDSAIIDKAFVAFEKSWAESDGTPMLEMSSEDAMRMSPRIPAIYLEMLHEYLDARANIFQDPTFELIACEQPFAVPLDPQDDTLFYVGRLDKVFRLKGKMYIGEHKTTAWYKKDGYFRPDWMDAFSLDSQIDGYLHAGHVLYGEELQALWIDGALVHKNIHDGFRIIPINKKIGQLDAWLWETLYQIGQIELNKVALLREREKKEPGPYLAAFPRNRHVCYSYGKACPYIEQCRGWSNPEVHEHPPMGFVESRWSPFDVLKLAEIGLENPDVAE